MGTLISLPLTMNDELYWFLPPSISESSSCQRQAYRMFLLWRKFLIVLQTQHYATKSSNMKLKKYYIISIQESSSLPPLKLRDNMWTIILLQQEANNGTIKCNAKAPLQSFADSIQCLSTSASSVMSGGCLSPLRVFPIDLIVDSIFILHASTRSMPGNNKDIPGDQGQVQQETSSQVKSIAWIGRERPLWLLALDLDG